MPTRSGVETLTDNGVTAPCAAHPNIVGSTNHPTTNHVFAATSTIVPALSSSIEVAPTIESPESFPIERDEPVLFRTTYCSPTEVEAGKVKEPLVM